MNEPTLEVIKRIARDMDLEAFQSGDRMMAAINGNYKLIIYLIDKIDRLEEKIKWKNGFVNIYTSMNGNTVRDYIIGWGRVWVDGWMGE